MWARARRRLPVGDRGPVRHVLGLFSQTGTGPLPFPLSPSCSHCARRVFSAIILPPHRADRCTRWTVTASNVIASNVFQVHAQHLAQILQRLRGHLRLHHHEREVGRSHQCRCVLTFMSGPGLAPLVLIVLRGEPRWVAGCWLLVAGWGLGVGGYGVGGYGVGGWGSRCVDREPHVKIIVVAQGGGQAEHAIAHRGWR